MVSSRDLEVHRAPSRASSRVLARPRARRRRDYRAHLSPRPHAALDAVEDDLARHSRHSLTRGAFSLALVASCVVLARATHAARMASIRELFAGARATPRPRETPCDATRADDEMDGESVGRDDGRRDDVVDDADDARARRSSAVSTARATVSDADALDGARATAPTTYGRRKRAKSLNAASARRGETTTKALPSATRAYLDSIGRRDGKNSKCLNASASIATKMAAKTGEVVKKKRTQMCLDLGQSTMRHETCAKCGLVYAKGEPDDEKTHAQYHAKFLANADGCGAITLKPGDGQSMVWESDDGDVRCVRLDASKANTGAIERVCKKVERELSLPENWIFDQTKSQVRTFVCVEKKGNRVVGALFAEKLSQAFRTLPDVKSSTSATEGTIVSHSGIPESARCGVRAIWTHSKARRRGLAREMLNSMRAHLVPGYVIASKECAFTQPTEAGTALALAYCDSDTFLVY